MPPKVINTANRILRSHFNFHVPLRNQEDGTWTLNGEYSQFDTIDSKGFVYTLWPFMVKESLSKVAVLYPLYFSCNIKLKPNDDINEVNIRIYKEEILRIKESSTIQTELLLRIEWSNEAIPANAQHIHAQPHWHIHSYKNIDIASRFPNFDEKTVLELLQMDSPKSEVASFMDNQPAGENRQLGSEPGNEAKTIPPFKFHLSMLSDWHKQKNSPHNNILTEEVLSMWLPQCLSYLKDQVEYIYERM
jgi:hypothetical protein